MVFSSAVFLVYFLPALLLLYFIAAKQFRNAVLLAASVVFYSWGAPKFIFVILGTTLLDFVLVNAMYRSTARRKRRFFLALSILINLGLLVYFKYSNFFVENVNAMLSVFGSGTIGWTKLALPIGISFYTFETMTYVVDVYRGVHAPQKKFGDYLLYIILFPKLIAGPIIRYHEIAGQLDPQNRPDSADGRILGFVRFCIGLAKKMLIANMVGSYADTVYGNEELHMPGLDPAAISTGVAWLAAISYTFQIYFDFSGYSDMAIGLGRMFGFRFPENFNNPYIAESITDFWRRWHMTLGAWMKNYLYIPLGGNQVNARRMYFNLVVVFLLSGLWHGASWNFVIWGAWHGLFLVLERVFLLKFTARLGRVFRIGFTFFIVVLGWVMFRNEHVGEAFRYIKAMFAGAPGSFEYMHYRQLAITLALAAFFSLFCLLPGGPRIQQFFYSGERAGNPGFILLTGVSLALFLFSLSYVATSSFNPFIYFRF